MCKSSSATEGRADEILDLNLVLREVLWMQCYAGEAHRDFQDDVSEFESGLRNENGNVYETCHVRGVACATRNKEREAVLVEHICDVN